ncbi:MAG: S49 family peptidase [Chloroflexi bacterium]|nr:S49 family peptidase [Chloroflexota bacterium]
MNRLGDLWRLLFRWQIPTLLMAGIGIVAGYIVFLNVFPGKPQVGLIDVPYTIISDESAQLLGQMLDFAQGQRHIKEVVIRLSSPGGGAAASEELFLKTMQLREKKPVVTAVQDIAASGGYLWSMGSNYIFAKPTSFVGSVGALITLPRQFRAGEDLATTGPAKLTGGSRRTYVGILEMLKDSFLEIVVSQRGDRLRITSSELVEARIYPGLEAVRLGMVDAIGSDNDAIEKAAGLAGIAHYELMDVNVEVFRLQVQKLRSIYPGEETQGAPKTLGELGNLRNLLPSLILKDTAEVALPGLPRDFDLPHLYYLYVPPSE